MTDQMSEQGGFFEYWTGRISAGGKDHGLSQSGYSPDIDARVLRSGCPSHSLSVEQAAQTAAIPHGAPQQLLLLLLLLSSD